MKTIIALLLCLFVSGCQVSEESRTRSNKSKKVSTLTEEQKAALELGYLYGSKINLVALPQPLKNKSYAGIDYSMDELGGMFEKLRIVKPSADGFIDLTNKAFAEANPIEGAKKLLDVINALKTTLSLVFPGGTSQSNIWRVYRIGYVLGYEFELAAITSSSNPSDQNLTTFTGLSQQIRVALPEDLSSGDLPDNIQSMIRATNIEVTKTENLEKIIKTSQELYNFIRTSQ